MAKHSNEEAAALGTAVWGRGWLLPTATWLAAEGYLIVAVRDIFFAEMVGVAGTVAGVVLLIKNSSFGADSPKSELWVPIEREEDDDDD